MKTDIEIIEFAMIQALGAGLFKTFEDVSIIRQAINNVKSKLEILKEKYKEENEDIKSMV